MSIKNKPPKYLTGESDISEDSLVWVIHTGPPFLMAAVRPKGMVGMHLHCWPPTVQTSIPPAQLADIISKLASIWAEYVEQLPGLPDSWGYTFDDLAVPPKHIYVDAAFGTEWEGVLHTQEPVFIFRFSDDGMADYFYPITDILELWAGKSPNEITELVQQIARDAFDFFMDFRKNEAEEFERMEIEDQK